MHWARKGPRSNKANCRVDSKWARGGKPVLAAGATHCAKRSQFAAYQPEEVPAGRAISVAAAGASAPNKANRSRVTRKASTLWRTSYGELNPQRALAKQSQFAPGRGLARRSVPPVGPIVRSRANRWVPWCTNKANDHRETASCAKQTQSAVAGCANEANGPPEGRGGRTNKANSRERRRGIRLLASLRTRGRAHKRSQFPHEQQGARAGKAARTAGGSCRAKQSQFPEDDWLDGSGTHRRRPDRPRFLGGGSFDLTAWGAWVRLWG